MDSETDEMWKHPCGGIYCTDSDAICMDEKCYCISTLTYPRPDGSCQSPESDDYGAHVEVPEFPIENKTVPATTAETAAILTKSTKTPNNNNNKTAVIIVKESDLPLKSTALPPSFVKSTISRALSPEQQPDALPLVVPIVVGACAVVLFLCLTVYLCRRKKTYRNSQQGSPISWMRRHNGFSVIDNMETLLKNPNYYSMSPDAGRPSIFKEKEISPSRLNLLNVIGEGAFGQVYKGELLDAEGDGFIIVAVKLLKEGVSREIREDLEREVDITSAFNHQNILPLLGVVTRDNVSTPYMVFEFMTHGDLASLLRKNDPIMREHDKDELLLKQMDLIDICVQIARGMQYLASQHFVHRDLATRNCLVGENLVVKISDFGMSRDIYTCDYYKVGGSRMLPVRWMAPECIRYGRFTKESDIWAFGVVLWEVFSFGKQPYYGHSNDEVVCFINEGILLQRPPDSTNTLYSLMLSCWRENPNARIPFHDIVSCLEAYNNTFKRKFDAPTPSPEEEVVQIDSNEETDVHTTVMVKEDLERLENLKEDIV